MTLRDLIPKNWHHLYTKHQHWLHHYHRHQNNITIWATQLRHVDSQIIDDVEFAKMR
jgi:hypothetical protein